MHISFARQALSFAGALMILIAYAGHQLRWVDPRKVWYNVLNAVGSGILGYIALQPFQVGFVMLEVIWALISLYVLWRITRHPKDA